MRSRVAMPPVVVAVLAAGLGWVAAEQLYVLLGGGVFVSRVGDDAVVLAAAALCVAAGRRGERLAWSLLGAGLAFWAVGDLFWVFALAELDQVPVPSPADAGYLAFCPLAFAALALLVHARVGHPDVGVYVDAATAALAVGAVAAATVFEAALAAAEGDALAVATNLAYPLADLALLGLVVAAVALQRWRVDRTWALLCAAVCAFWAADALYLVSSAAGWYEPGGFFDPWWSLAALLFAAAAWQPRPERAPAATERKASERTVILPLCFAAAGLAVLAAAAAGRLNALAVALAVASLLAVLGRLAVSLQANLRLLEASRREAVTDALTGLGNRRLLLRDLDRAVGAPRSERPVALALFDLDGFKNYNDGACGR